MQAQQRLRRQSKVKPEDNAYLMTNILQFKPRSAVGGSKKETTGAPENMEHPIAENASKLSYLNHDNIQKGTPCGCYFCLHVFDGGDVTDWADGGKTALCPRCDIDAVMPGVTDQETLEAAHERWFCRSTDESQTQA